MKPQKYIVSLHLFLFLTLLSNVSVSTEDVTQTFSLDGRAFGDSAATSPLLDASISFVVQILNPAQTCILYEETQAKSTLLTSGYFTLQVGSPTSDPKRSANDSNHSMVQVYSNTQASISGKLLSNGAACTYNPASGHTRYFRIVMTPSFDSLPRVLSPMTALDSVPTALVAERAENIQGLVPNQILQVNTTSSDLSQANLESLFATTSFTRLTNLASKPTTDYVQTGSNGSAALPVVSGDPSSGLASGQIWYDSVANQLKYYDGSVKTLGSGGGSGTVTSVSATSPISVATGTSTPAISITQANGTTNGYLTSGDWTTFNSKLSNFTTMISSDVTTALGYTPLNSVNTQITAADGNAGAPSLSFSNNTDMGWFRPAANTLAASTTGLERIRILASGDVGIGTTTPNLRLNVGDGATNDGGILAQGYGTVGTDGTTLTTAGAGTKMIWYPKKAAFRAGYVSDNKWDDSHIGLHSIALGSETEARGTSAVAIGWNSYAFGDYSFAEGTGSNALANLSVALGPNAMTTGVRSFAFMNAAAGNGATVNGQGDFSFALGANDPGVVTVQPKVTGTGSVGVFLGGTANSTDASTSNVMTIMGGNVGIGTTAPTAGLHVTKNGAADTPSQRIDGTWFSGGTTTTTKPMLLIEPAGTTSTPWSTGGTGFGINAASGFAGNIMDVKANGTSQFSITNNGNVNAHIRLSTPEIQTLLLSGSTYTTSSAAVQYPQGAGVWWMRNTNNVDNEYAGTIAFTAANTAGNIQTAFITSVAATGGGNYSPALVFGQSNAAAGYAESMRIDSGGNVGIGTTTPVATLDVNGTMRLAKNIGEPYSCDAPHDGAIALTHLYTMCVCNGGSTTWVETADGTTACTW